MTTLLRRLYRDEGGAMISAELIFLLTILVLGLVVGIAAVRNGLNHMLWSHANYMTASDATEDVSPQQQGLASPKLAPDYIVTAADVLGE